MRHVWVLLALCSCDYAFRIDHIDPVATDASDAPGTEVLCGEQRPGVVAYYPFDDDTDTMQLTDRGLHARHGSLSSGVVTTTTGPTDCGAALQIVDGREASIPYAPEFQLDTGSIDLWVRPIPLSTVSPTRVVVARDVGNNNPGDFSLFEHRLATTELIFVVRLQSGDAAAGGGTYRCSQTAVVAGTWYHVAVNFGAPDLELYVDGTLQQRSTTITINGEAATCGASTAGQSPTVGLDGTPQKSWFLGYGDVSETQVVRRYLSSGGLDHFRIRSERY